MKAKEITVSAKLVKNLGNYQSASYEASITIQIEDNEKSKDIYELAWASVKNEIEKQIQLLKIEVK